jgi:hypothetical protein
MPAAEAVDQKESHSSAASVFVKDVTVPIRLLIKNSTDCSLEINWLDYKGQPVNYGSLAPNWHPCKASITQSEHKTTAAWDFMCSTAAH